MCVVFVCVSLGGGGGGGCRGACMHIYMCHVVCVHVHTLMHEQKKHREGGGGGGV